MLSEKLQKLHEQIQPAFTKTMLDGLPDNEAYDYAQYKLFPLELLVKADWNYKGEDEAASKKLRENIKRNGQTETIHVRLLHTGYYEVINGNHRVDEMAGLERKSVLAYDHGQITQEEAIRRCLETNEKWFDTDSVKLGNLMKQLTDTTEINDLISTMPFAEEEIHNFIKLAELDSGEITPVIMDGINLPDGDKSEYEQITFTMHKDQMADINVALELCRGLNKDAFKGEENKNRNGNALYFITKHYLAANGAKGTDSPAA